MTELLTADADGCRIPLLPCPPARRRSGQAYQRSYEPPAPSSVPLAPQAAEALRPIADDFAFTIFALGIIGTGLLALPVLAGSAATPSARLCNGG
jgi:hypothetical protein